MKKRICFVLILFICLIITNIVLIIVFNEPKEEKSENIIPIEEIDSREDKQKNITEENETFVVEVENKKEETNEENNEETKEEEKDAAKLTEEIYNINGKIGELNIPKTELTTEIYSNVTVDKMDEMPCFLYTTGGLNKVGTTLFVGHNRRDGKIFSKNNQLEIGDEFYFTDFEGTELKYTINSKFITTDSDTSFLNDDVNKPTIVLSCCTDEDDENRIIIIGEAKYKNGKIKLPFLEK